MIQKRIHLSPESAARLQQLTQTKALGEIFDEPSERGAWSFLSEDSLARVWDNEEDAIYDNWREYYGVPAG